MRLPVRAVIFFYIFICVVLLLFNLLYIFALAVSSGGRNGEFTAGKPIWTAFWRAAPCGIPASCSAG